MHTPASVWCMVVVAVHTCHMTHFHERALAGQSLAFQCYGNKVDSNFIQLLKLCGLDKHTLQRRQVHTHYKKYIQKELFILSPLCTLRKISAELHHYQFFCTMSYVHSSSFMNCSHFCSQNKVWNMAWVNFVAKIFTLKQGGVNDRIQIHMYKYVYIQNFAPFVQLRRLAHSYMSITLSWSSHSRHARSPPPAAKKGKIPRKLYDWNAESDYPDDLQTMYQQKYYEALDLMKRYSLTLTSFYVTNSNFIATRLYHLQLSISSFCFLMDIRNMFRECLLVLWDTAISVSHAFHCNQREVF